MRRKRWIRCLGIVALLAAWLPACTKPPEVPSLPRREPLAIQKIVLSEKIGPEEVRQIFRAINSNGSLDELKPYFETASDQSMELAGSLITKYLYRDQTLLSLVRYRFENKDFTRLNNWVDRWSKNPTFSSERDLSLAVFESPRLPRLLDRDIYLLDNEVLRSLKNATDKADKSYVAMTVADQPAVDSPNGVQVVTDIKATLNNKTVIDQFVTTARVMDDNYAGSALLQGLHAFQSENNDAYKYFEGFGHGLRKMLENPPQGDAANGKYLNQLDLLLHFADVANQDTHSLFLGLQNGLAPKNELVDYFNANLQAPLLGAISGWIQKKINDAHFDSDFWSKVNADDSGPSPQFNQLFEKILEGVTQIIPLRPDGAREQFIYNAPLLLNSFALTKWFEQMEKKNPGVFTNGVGENSLNVSMVQVAFVTSGAGGLTFPYEKQMTDVKFGSFVPAFRQFVTDGIGSYRDYNYILTRASSRGQVTTGQALRTAVSDCHNGFYFSQTAPIIRSLAYKLTHPREGSLLALANFGTVSLMDSLNNLISFNTLTSFRSIKDVLFSGTGINLANLDAAQKNVLLGLLHDPSSEHDLLNELLNSVQAIPEMDVTLAKDLPSAFETYFSINAFTSTGFSVNPSKPGTRAWISSFLSFLSKGRFFGLATLRARKGSLPAPLFPSAYQLVQGSSISRRFHELSWLEPEDRPIFLRGMSKAFGVSKQGESGARFHVDFLHELISSNEKGVESVWDRLVSDDMTIDSFADLFTDAEYDWAFRAIAAGDHASLWRLIKENGSTPQLEKFVRTMLTLLKNGTLERALGLLTYINDTRIKDLATTGLEMYRNGELERLLTAAETFLSK